MKYTGARARSGRTVRAFPLLLLLAAQALDPALARADPARAGSVSAWLPAAGQKPVDTAPDADQDDALQRLMRELRSLRKSVVPAVVRALSGLAPTPAEAGSSGAMDLDDDQARIVLEGLAPLRTKTRVAELESCVRTSARDRTAIGVLRVLAERGSSSELGMATRAAINGRATEGPDLALDAALRSAISKILRRDPNGYDKLSELL